MGLAALQPRLRNADLERSASAAHAPTCPHRPRRLLFSRRTRGGRSRPVPGAIRQGPLGRAGRIHGGARGGLRQAIGQAPGRLQLLRLLERVELVDALALVPAGGCQGTALAADALGVAFGRAAHAGRYRTGCRRPLSGRALQAARTGRRGHLRAPPVRDEQRQQPLLGLHPFGAPARGGLHHAPVQARVEAAGTRAEGR